MRRIHQFVGESNSRVKQLRGGVKFAHALEHLRGGSDSDDIDEEIETKSSKFFRKDTEASKIYSSLTVSKEELNEYSNKLKERLEKNGAEYFDDSTRQKIDRNSEVSLSRRKLNADHDEWSDNKQYQPYMHLQNVPKFDRPVTDLEVWQRAKAKFDHIKNIQMKELLIASEVFATRKRNKKQTDLKLKELQGLKMEVFFQKLSSKPTENLERLKSSKGSESLKGSRPDLMLGASRSSFNALPSLIKLDSKEDIHKLSKKRNIVESTCHSLRVLDAQNRALKTSASIPMIKRSYPKPVKKHLLIDEVTSAGLKENSLNQLFSVGSVSTRATKYVVKSNSKKGFSIRDIELDKQIHALTNSMKSKKNDDQLINNFISTLK